MPQIKNQKMAALTFDDGPSHTTPSILRLLEQYGCTATFCLVGERIRSRTEIVRQIAAQGSEIAGHTWSHRRLTNLTEVEIRQELTDSAEVIYETTGVTPAFLRAPYGSCNGLLLEIAKEKGYALLGWNVDPEDWKSRDPAKVYQEIMKNVRPGAIILCHDLYPETAAAMEFVIPALLARGYRLAAVSEQFRLREKKLQAGHIYRSL